ncbi:MAG: hypothetical protein K5629_01720, partial [Eubacteriales bacterium]|nr:hypothetical protein [Eubacteriales bacterium]
MNRYMKKTIAFICILAMLASFASCGGSGSIRNRYLGSHLIVLNGNTATIDGKMIETSDYTWHADPSTVHADVKNAPAEYYTGTKLQTNAAAYIDHELFYFPALDQSGFKQVKYDGEMEYAYYYTDGVNDGYIFATLPVLGESFPSHMMHTEAEAA